MPTDKTLDYLLHQLRLIEEHRERDCELKVRKCYKELIKDLNNFLGNEYAELAQDDKLTFEILHRKGKYARFIEEVEQRTNYFTGQAAKAIKEMVQTTYKKSFDGMVKAVEQAQSYYDLKLNLRGLKATTPEVIKNAVKNTFLEDALEKNHKTVIYDIKQQIGVGLSQGDRMSTMARRINEQLDKDYKKATQIVRTECHRVREAGYQDSSERINNILRDSDGDYVMVKVWRTKQDERVRPQQRRRSKKGWKTTYSKNGANHVAMDGITVLVDERFELPSGATAITPGQSGVASEDINCRCGVSRDFITKAEYAKIKGESLDNIANVLKDSTMKLDTGIYPDDIAGVKRGEPMSFEQANSCNVNPKYGTQLGYSVNCQSCVVTFEARQRGYDVYTLPNTKGSVLEVLSRKTNLAWIDPETKEHPKYIFDDSKIYNAKTYLQYLNKIIEKDNRYTIEFSWKGRRSSGHIVNIDRDDFGILRIKDNQRGKTEKSEWLGEKEILQYLRQMKYAITFAGKKYACSPRILRIDNMRFNMDIVEKIMKGKG